MIMPTHYCGTREEELALNTFIKLTRATESLMARLAKHNAHPGLTVSQFGVLETLYHLGPMCQNELGGKLLKSGGNITLVIDNLEKHGLVHRERGIEDRRFINVSLTDAGRKLIAEVFPEQVKAITEEMSALSSDEQQELGDLCRKLGKSKTS
jgi:MarR family 2-MHQ and catechol resistance regulon transcriptional repressor